MDRIPPGLDQAKLQQNCKTDPINAIWRKSLKTINHVQSYVSQSISAAYQDVYSVLNDVILRQ
jgi:hypothetical protein